MKPLAEALRDIPQFADLPDVAIAWLAANSEEEWFEAGAVTIGQGEPADYMYLVLEGEVEARAEAGSTAPPFIGRAPMITGVLPHSRMKTIARTVRAVLPSRIASLHKSRFDEMLEVIPELESRLVALMADRIRDTANADIQQEKLAALGKLSAGLAHELNNPAAAVARNIKTLRDKLQEMVGADLPASRPQPLNALARTDAEDELGSMLSGKGLRDAWELAADLADAGFTKADAEGMSPDSLRRAALALSVDRLAADIEDAAARISALVRSVKEYSFMDTAAEREVDIHAGLDNTLTMLSYRLRGIGVLRQYDAALPRLCGHGAELNQVWTNLIDNAADAMAESAEKTLTIRTALRGENILVEIRDTGSGIPEDLGRRIFEPFFTTKKQGQGTGLGLDIVFRIVKKHRGDITFQSGPGGTCFQVTLPLAKPGLPG